MSIWTTRTILVFGKQSSWYGKTLQNSIGKITFWDYRENELIHWRYILKISPMLGATPQGLLFSENKHSWNFRTCSFWRNCTFGHIWTVSQSISVRSPYKLTPTTAATRRQLSHLARALAHSAQGWNIPFGNPSLQFSVRPLNFIDLGPIFIW